MKNLAIAALVCAAGFAAAPAMAQSAGEMTFGIGFGVVDPAGSPGTLAGTLKTKVGDNTRPTFTFEYFVQDNIGIEILAATPFKHEVSVVGTGKIGSVKHLPPTVSVNYHIPTNSAVTPFVGLGLNYTTFFGEKSNLGDLKLDDSFGFAAHLGMDYAINDASALRMDLRYIDISTDAKLNGKKIGTLDLNPLVAGVSYVIKF